MTQTVVYPLKGCQHLEFKYVSNAMDSDLDFWAISCSKKGCKKQTRDGGPSKSCFTDPYEVTIGGEDGEGRADKDDGRA
jgi:hypothetical protein